MKNTTLLVCICVLLVGCGSAGSGSTANNMAMQGGQWEYVVTPESGGMAMYVDSNVPGGTNLNFSGSNSVLINPAYITQGPGPILCEGYAMSGNIEGGKVDAQFITVPDSRSFATFSGQLAPSGQSISAGKYSGGTCSVGNPTTVKGTLTGYTVAPLNGTFTGTLTSNLYGADVVTISFSQNPDFSVNTTGAYVENGVSTSFVNVTGRVVGAALSVGGSAANVNGNSQFTAVGHLNPAATQLTIVFIGVQNDSEVATGVLTKQ